ncbi:MAG: hypothetical protein CVV44_20940 [Spirochaetae bacterium HGW-Spirochaetae-1]|nr:MAG: hypothetical protein CVV44_20940 [Spirochaetae bacterium HGW-Spirochaetae-1]
MLSQNLYGHGVTAASRIGRAVIVDIRYDDGEPFSYAAVKIYAPGNNKIEYMNSRTDADGVIAFVPKAIGTWRLTAADDMAHGKELQIEISDETLNKNSQGNWANVHKQKMISSFLLIWAVVSTSLFIGARNKRKELKALQ